MMITIPDLLLSDQTNRIKALPKLVSSSLESKTPTAINVIMPLAGSKKQNVNPLKVNN
jgi:hypothetical protein